VRRFVIILLAFSMVFMAVTPVKADSSVTVYYASDENSMVYSALKFAAFFINNKYCYP
jgi:hypothetical protein